MKTVFREGRSRDAQFKGAQTQRANVRRAELEGKITVAPFADLRGLSP